MQISSTMIKLEGNLGRISQSEKVSFQMVTERNMLLDDREWIPKNRDSNIKRTSPMHGF